MATSSDLADLEAAVLSRFSSLQTDDQDEIIDKMKSILGNEITLESCRFFLDASNWDLAKALGAFYDCNLDSSALARLLAQSQNSSNLEMEIAPARTTAMTSDFVSYSYSASLIYNPNDVPTASRDIRLCIQNTGSQPWPHGAFIKPQLDANTAPFVTRNQNNQPLWLPMNPNDTCELTPCYPGEHVTLSIAAQEPTGPALEYLKTIQKPLVGACSIFLQDGTVFGDTLYFSVVPMVSMNELHFVAGCQAYHTDSVFVDASLPNPPPDLSQSDLALITPSFSTTTQLQQQQADTEMS